ncbi:hypothetical protein BLNAU_7672 [Blattamonas nauphoetae]|uniref:Galectin n=1 Tax=Blattamonas nauphoetae TaxID=2049346 RepID=A0ABQ9Y0U8_9EUKA|nr:hypothetical protein BLNAU_7672 [Blattamonas nauphoetae]
MIKLPGNCDDSINGGTWNILQSTDLVRGDDKSSPWSSVLLSDTFTSGVVSFTISLLPSSYSVSLNTYGNLWIITPSSDSYEDCHSFLEEGDCVRMEVDLDSTPRTVHYFVNGLRLALSLSSQWEEADGLCDRQRHFGLVDGALSMEKCGQLHLDRQEIVKMEDRDARTDKNFDGDCADLQIGLGADLKVYTQIRHSSPCFCFHITFSTSYI